MRVFMYMLYNKIKIQIDTNNELLRTMYTYVYELLQRKKKRFHSLIEIEIEIVVEISKSIIMH
jgi:hypothetical protein